MSRIAIQKTDYIGGRYFKAGEEYDFAGTETVTEGCACNGSLKQVNTYVVLLDNVKYHVPQDRAAIIQI